MANSITIDVAQFTDLNKKFKGLEKELREGVEGILYKNAAALSLQAKQRAPTDIGGLKNSISTPVNTADLEFTISVNAFYAAFVEFGTGKYAAEYVSTLPADWASYAASFKGKKGNGDFDKFVLNIYDWIKRKGSTPKDKTTEQSYDPESGNIIIKKKKKQSKDQKEEALQNLAYVIAVSIFLNGVRPQPFLYPAYQYVKPFILKDIETLLKSLNA
jgi:HK97 gp10 family phage protein